MSSTKKELLGAGILALLGNLFFFRIIGVAGAAFSLLLFNVFILIVCFKKKISFNAFTVILEIFVLVFLSLSLFRTTPVIQTLLLGSSLASTILLCFLFSSELFFFSAVKQIVALPFVMARTYLSVIFDRLILIGNDKKIPVTQRQSLSSKNILSTLLGLFIGLPVVALLVMLLSQADPIFAKTINDILNHFSLTRLTYRIMLSVFLFLFFIPWGLLSIKSTIFKSGKTKLPHSLLHPITIVMMLVGITLGVFLMVQWPYVFARVAAETDLSKFGVATYSEYVKKGFVELLFVSGIVYSLLWMGLLSIRAKQEKQFHPLQFIQSLVICLYAIFLFSIGRRIFLYWDLHGLSLIRIYGGVFLCWIGFLTVTLWARHFFNAKYIVIELLGTLLLIASLGGWNAEQFIVSHHPPTVNGVVDMVYLSRLSADGYEGWKQVFILAKKVIERKDYQTKKH